MGGPCKHLTEFQLVKCKKNYLNFCCLLIARIGGGRPLELQQCPGSFDAHRGPRQGHLPPAPRLLHLVVVVLDDDAGLKRQVAEGARRWGGERGEQQAGEGLPAVTV